MALKPRPKCGARQITMPSNRPRIRARKPFASLSWRSRSCRRHAPPHVETLPPPPSSPEKGAPLPERRNIAGVELALSAAAKGDGLAPRRSGGVRLASAWRTAWRMAEWMLSGGRIGIATSSSDSTSANRDGSRRGGCDYRGHQHRGHPRGGAPRRHPRRALPRCWRRLGSLLAGSVLHDAPFAAAPGRRVRCRQERGEGKSLGSEVVGGMNGKCLSFARFLLSGQMLLTPIYMQGS
jgi:hypothetical protein